MTTTTAERTEFKGKNLDISDLLPKFVMDEDLQSRVTFKNNELTIFKPHDVKDGKWLNVQFENSRAHPGPLWVRGARSPFPGVVQRNPFRLVQLPTSNDSTIRARFDDVLFAIQFVWCKNDYQIQIPSDKPSDEELCKWLNEALRGFIRWLDLYGICYVG